MPDNYCDRSFCKNKKRTIAKSKSLFVSRSWERSEHSQILAESRRKTGENRMPKRECQPQHSSCILDQAGWEARFMVIVRQTVPRVGPERASHLRNCQGWTAVHKTPGRQSRQQDSAGGRPAIPNWAPLKIGGWECECAWLPWRHRERESAREIAQKQSHTRCPEFKFNNHWGNNGKPAAQTHSATGECHLPLDRNSWMPAQGSEGNGDNVLVASVPSSYGPLWSQ